MTIKIVLADDHTILNESLAALLDKEPDLQIVAQAHSGLETLHMVQKYAPDIVVLDIFMGDINGRFS